MKKRMITLICVLAAVAALTAFAALAAGGAGSRSDPLVTLSYLNETFTGQVMDRVDVLLEEQRAALVQELAGQTNSDGYTAVTLSGGQTLLGEAGCEVLLRTGSASCTGTGTAALIDTTAGGSLGGGGRLTVNHLYLLSDSRGIAASGEVTLLVRGAYVIG